jgi:hypothetical protein
MRKPRSDAILLNLPEDQQAKLADWLLSGVPYHEARLLTEKEFGVTLRSLDPFKRFWQDVCTPHLLERRRRAVTTADERAEDAKAHPAQFDAATLDAIKQKAYEISESPQAKPQEVKTILALLLKVRDQDLQERRLGFDQTRFSEASRTKQQAGLEWVADAFKDNPAALAKYQEARAMIEPA